MSSVVRVDLWSCTCCTCSRYTCANIRPPGCDWPVVMHPLAKPNYNSPLFRSAVLSGMSGMSGHLLLVRLLLRLLLSRLLSRLASDPFTFTCIFRLLFAERGKYAERCHVW